MKNKKILIAILILVIILLIVTGIIAFFVIQNSKDNTNKYDAAVKKYERIVRVAKKVNDEIDTEVNKAKQFIDTNPDVR